MVDSYFLIKKPFIIRPWNSVEQFAKKKFDVVPTWVQLEGLEIKYWGVKSLFKIVEQVGKPIQVDDSIKHRDKLMFPRYCLK